MIDLPSLIPSNNAILINKSNLSVPLVSQLQLKCDNPDNWHKFIVTVEEGEQAIWTRNVVLKTIMDFVQPSDFIPVNYMFRVNKCYFLVRNCLDALLKIVKGGLVIINPNPPGSLRIEIVANICSKYTFSLESDMEDNLKSVLSKRFQKADCCLDLQNFHNDDDLMEYIPLQQPKIMKYVMHLASELAPTRINLSDNSLQDVSSLSLLSRSKIKIINLGNNNLASLDDLESLKEHDIIDLYLDGNPLCDKYDAVTYVKQLRILCRGLRVLDKQMVYCINLIRPIKNFLCFSNGTDLVNQFMEHFFTAYDFNSRKGLAELYHENALFSLTSKIVYNQKLIKQTNKEKKAFKHYESLNRNILSKDSNAQQERLFRGRSKIMELLLKLPQTVHYSYSFRTDLICYTGTFVVIMVTGTFKEVDQILGFTRTFSLQGENNEYSIVNDQLHVFNTPVLHKYKGPQFAPDLKYSCNPIPYKDEQYTELVKTVHLITNLKQNYSKEYLSQFNYNLKNTLNHFLELYINDEIPAEMFAKGTEGFLSTEESTSGLHNKGTPELEQQYAPAEGGAQIKELHMNNEVFYLSDGSTEQDKNRLIDGLGNKNFRKKHGDKCIRKWRRQRQQEHKLAVLKCIQPGGVPAKSA